MKISRSLLASIFLTAIILAVVSGFASAAMAQRKIEDQAAAVEQPGAGLSPVDAGQDVAVYQEREAAYRQTIEQANQQLLALQDRLAQLEGQSAAASSPALAAAVTPEQALQAAREAAGPGMSESRAPELVSFEDKAAYEVPFEAGTIYIDAQTGEVLFNGTLPQEITADQAAQIASDYLNIQGILKVDQINFRGAPLWRVIFKNSTMAYLDLTGQITYVLKDSNKPTTVLVNGGGGGDDGFSGGSDDDQHYEDEDDDDDDEHEDD